MIYTLQTEHFILTLKDEPITSPHSYYDDTAVTVFIQSHGYSATATMEVESDAFPSFKLGLEKLYETLTGEVCLQDGFYEALHISFEADRKGHIKISGRLFDHDPEADYSHELEFLEVIDQAELKSFVESLRREE